jgi:hypothetical protein
MDQPQPVNTAESLGLDLAGNDQPTNGDEPEQGRQSG